MSSPSLTESAIKRLIERACREVEKRDHFLLEHDVSEWAVAHRLAVYLEGYFGEYNVDCEYNTMPGELGRYAHNEHIPKMIAGRPKRPDIIIHRRGSKSAGNLAAIELKKAGNKDGFTDDQNDLVALRDKFGYQILCQLIINDESLAPIWL